MDTQIFLDYMFIFCIFLIIIIILAKQILRVEAFVHYFLRSFPMFPGTKEII